MRIVKASSTTALSQAPKKTREIRSILEGSEKVEIEIETVLKKRRGKTVRKGEPKPIKKEDYDADARERGRAGGRSH